MLSASSCAELGWPPPNGSETCSHAKMDGTCELALSWAQAHARCEAAGARLCDPAELADFTHTRLCELDERGVWASNACNRSTDDDPGHVAVVVGTSASPSGRCSTANATEALVCCADSHAATPLTSTTDSMGTMAVVAAALAVGIGVALVCWCLMRSLNAWASGQANQRTQRFHDEAENGHSPGPVQDPRKRVARAGRKLKATSSEMELAMGSPEGQEVGSRQAGDAKDPARKGRRPKRGARGPVMWNEDELIVEDEIDADKNVIDDAL